MTEAFEIRKIDESSFALQTTFGTRKFQFPDVLNRRMIPKGDKFFSDLRVLRAFERNSSGFDQLKQLKTLQLSLKTSFEAVESFFGSKSTVFVSNF